MRYGFFSLVLFLILPKFVWAESSAVCTILYLADRHYFPYVRSELKKDGKKALQYARKIRRGPKASDGIPLLDLEGDTLTAILDYRKTLKEVRRVFNDIQDSQLKELVRLFNEVKINPRKGPADLAISISDLKSTVQDVIGRAEKLLGKLRDPQAKLRLDDFIVLSEYITELQTVMDVAKYRVTDELVFDFQVVVEKMRDRIRRPLGLPTYSQDPEDTRDIVVALRTGNFVAFPTSRSLDIETMNQGISEGLLALGVTKGVSYADEQALLAGGFYQHDRGHISDMLRYGYHRRIDFLRDNYKKLQAIKKTANSYREKRLYELLWFYLTHEGYAFDIAKMKSQLQTLVENRSIYALTLQRINSLDDMGGFVGTKKVTRDELDAAIDKYQSFLDGL